MDPPDLKKMQQLYERFAFFTDFDSLSPFISFPKSFADVPLNENGVETQSFLEASDGLVLMFGKALSPCCNVGRRLL